MRVFVPSLNFNLPTRWNERITVPDMILSASSHYSQFFRQGIDFATHSMQRSLTALRQNPSDIRRFRSSAPHLGQPLPLLGEKWAKAKK